MPHGRGRGFRRSRRRAGGFLAGAVPSVRGSPRAKRLADNAETEAKPRADLDKLTRDAVSAEFEKLSPSYQRAVAAADRWKAEAIPGLDSARAGHVEIAAEVEVIYQQRIKKLREDDLARQET